MSTVFFNYMQDAFAGCSVDTCDLESNIYTEKIKPKRIDFVFFSDERCPKAEMEVQSKTLAVTGTIPGKEFPYSDHEGVEVVFRLKERTTPLVVSEQPLGGIYMYRILLYSTQPPPDRWISCAYLLPTH